LNGKIVEFYTRRPIGGVVVTVNGYTAITDSEGRFTLVNLPTGRSTLKTIHRDFRDHTQSLNLATNDAYYMDELRIQSKVRAL